jgi:4-hydroxy-3-methylbut-2-enyl diphosphate reductase
VVVVLNLEEAKLLEKYMLGEKSQIEFEKEFEGKFSKGFNIQHHFEKVGVINQTTMLASETQEIADFVKSAMVKKFGEAQIKNHFADTRDTLCYATKENQDATLGLLDIEADIAIVVGGYNSSNTQHLVELCEPKFKTFFISSSAEIESDSVIHHYDLHMKRRVLTPHFLPKNGSPKIIITSGASCPDSMLEHVIDKINGYYKVTKSHEEVLSALRLNSFN